ncbi:mannitol-1-phosphate 5-dehydrogenase [Halalkalibacterium halodurans]|uniref:Mannitol-1-phosphate 5-dehydrogenase n=1 Tax=Halalkalibacterium halodurans (strain ATCC BAA-125 / DSM 18197 / FERM 7344 / JCM 9153 / C-125) TaxID=272558 RepID=MTLD_HALH5|nr:mannitol-1-phosphate 5-dehydrogenase [Halalkalibacterium halodurans]Q9K681.1 RecName: Full=Mannitol-1-phosphate 5-dehydrogenase [Halalkalibacterium halodurans C-125]MED4079560.1 mannitol-1-phosphate 5-dehydrogenase [Halalkalibacterium halodurans]MED4084163.1 mannitol-1-phosphate 5-dehydrogenase [Halalkalibacterium halodurans]MED4104641.1 mannitol-1-phosphate 5-dehydrogenase [Halalkalibacterium halodurans]MED4108369.1 mannitol-1-phosphate 5-dehydrogenase [Halalkalibacterium halodurans]MED41
MKAIHFGAGNIGRGFIGALLSKANYEVVFVDVNAQVIDRLNEQRSYTVLTADEDNEENVIHNVRGLNSRTQMEQVLAEIATADLVTTAVGPSVLPHLAHPIGQGLLQRNGAPIQVIACENAIGASSMLQEYTKASLSEEEWSKVDRVTGFPNATVDRIVPAQDHADPLTVSVEPFYEWVIETKSMKGEPPTIDGVTYVEDLTPYIERKLFTVNTGHAMVAYLGFQKGLMTIKEAISDQTIAEKTRQALAETKGLLVHKYNFSPEAHDEYIEKIFKRYNNPYLSDRVERVGRNPIRKLGYNERLVKPARQLLDLGHQPTALLAGIQAAFAFFVEDDQESMELQEKRQVQGLEQTVVEVTGLPAVHPLVQMIVGNN